MDSALFVLWQLKRFICCVLYLPIRTASCGRESSAIYNLTKCLANTARHHNPSQPFICFICWDSSNPVFAVLKVVFYHLLLMIWSTNWCKFMPATLLSRVLNWLLIQNEPFTWQQLNTSWLITFPNKFHSAHTHLWLLLKGEYLVGATYVHTAQGTSIKVGAECARVRWWSGETDQLDYNLILT